MGYYETIMKDWRFTKNHSEYPQYAIGGLRYSSEYTLKTVASMLVGEVVILHGYALKRIK